MIANLSVVYRKSVRDGILYCRHSHLVCWNGMASLLDQVACARSVTPPANIRGPAGIEA
jgi:hypothetical protein